MRIRHLHGGQLLILWAVALVAIMVVGPVLKVVGLAPAIVTPLMLVVLWFVILLGMSLVTWRWFGASHERAALRKAAESMGERAERL